MNVIDRIKNLFKRGGYALSGQTLQTINDHEKINIDPAELERIERDFREYKGSYPKVEYYNSYGQKQKRDYMTLNMVKLTSELLSGLVFNEQCDISISDESEDKKDNTFKSADDFIKHAFEHNDFKKNFMRYLDPMFATGGLTVRPYANAEAGEIEYSWALANAFYPLRTSSNGIAEGVMKSVTTEIVGGKEVFYTLLEFHEWDKDIYVITNELYKSNNKGEVGKRIPLTDLYPDLQEETRIAGLTRPLFNYLKPAGFNNINPHSPLGLGLTDNCKSTLKQINDTWDQFNWEVQMGQRTVFVSDHMLSTRETEDGKPPVQIFDTNTNVYKSLQMDGETDFIKDVTNDIRTEQYTEAINKSLETLEMQLQLSVGTFSFNGRSVKTATEIVSENSLTYRTRNSHVNEIEKFIKGLIVSTLELAKATGLFDGEIPTFDNIGVDFDDGIFQDKTQQLNYIGKAKALGFIPSVKAIERVFELPEDVAKKWYKQIQNEQVELEPHNISDRASREIFGDKE
ncbi:phage portal protein [Oceanobacillus sojae]|uniref:Putative minor capsid protein, phage associated n=1 Tax=Oceanobacillus sojae TaxID=582851 RepID=A0A511ZII2_9BACI|nr:phage portal protein [Oceanobacillus sojae]GEN87240.1 putative minor capsid protein, phage associated [Oceanobacillus sojae]